MSALCSVPCHCAASASTLVPLARASFVVTVTIGSGSGCLASTASSTATSLSRLTWRRKVRGSKTVVSLLPLPFSASSWVSAVCTSATRVAIGNCVTGGLIGAPIRNSVTPSSTIGAVTNKPWTVRPLTAGPGAGDGSVSCASMLRGSACAAPAATGQKPSATAATKPNIGRNAIIHLGLPGSRDRHPRCAPLAAARSTRGGAAQTGAAGPSGYLKTLVSTSPENRTRGSGTRRPDRRGTDTDTDTDNTHTADNRRHRPGRSSRRAYRSRWPRTTSRSYGP